jgi:hypothetical protein
MVHLIVLHTTLCAYIYIYTYVFNQTHRYLLHHLVTYMPSVCQKLPVVGGGIENGMMYFVLVRQADLVLHTTRI